MLVWKMAICYQLRPQHYLLQYCILLNSLPDCIVDVRFRFRCYCTCSRKAKNKKSTQQTVIEQRNTRQKKPTMQCSAKLTDIAGSRSGILYYNDPAILPDTVNRAKHTRTQYITE